MLKEEKRLWKTVWNLVCAPVLICSAPPHTLNISSLCPGRVLCGLGCPQPPGLRRARAPLLSAPRVAGAVVPVSEAQLSERWCWTSQESFCLYLWSWSHHILKKMVWKKQWGCLKKHWGDFKLNLAVKNELEQDEDGARKRPCCLPVVVTTVSVTSFSWTLDKDGLSAENDVFDHRPLTGLL